jgi:hypothetical protein
VQVDPIKPKLKPPGSKRLKQNGDVLLSTSAFKFNLRRHTVVVVNTNYWAQKFGDTDTEEFYTGYQRDLTGLVTMIQAEAYTRPLFTQLEPFLTHNTP